MTENQCVNCGKNISARAFFCEECKANPVIPVAYKSENNPIKQIKSETVSTNEKLTQNAISKMNPFLKIISAALWLFTLAGGLFGGLTLIVGLASANGAPQQAAAAGMALGYAVIPYCISRAVTEIINLTVK
jgi:hypothetical protein